MTGPDYSHDGAWIYFNSSRSGRMQIWRVRSDGSAVERITDSPMATGFPIFRLLGVTCWCSPMMAMSSTIRGISRCASG